MNTLTFFHTQSGRKKVIAVAHTWDALRQDQVVAIINVLIHQPTRETAEPLILAILLDLRRRWYLISYLKKNLGEESYQTALLLTHHFIESYPRFEVNPFSVIKIGGFWKRSQKFYGPSGKSILSKMVFLEWIRTEVYYRQYYFLQKDPQAQDIALNKLIAALYRLPASSPNINHDIREPYNDFTIELRAEVIYQLPIAIRKAIFYHFETHREKWTKFFTYVYRNSGESIKETSYPNDMDLIVALKNLAGGALNMKTMEQVEASNALLELDEKIKRALENPTTN